MVFKNDDQQFTKLFFLLNLILGFIEKNKKDNYTVRVIEKLTVKKFKSSNEIAEAKLKSLNQYINIY